MRVETTTTATDRGASPQAADDTDVDPVTFKMIRHRLLAITDEQGGAQAAISGSLHVVSANDFNVGLYLPDGSMAAMGRTILLHSASMALITRHVIADCPDSQGIEPGDMFVVNNPWRGSVHAQDIGVVAPIFVDGELLAWTGSMCHMPDVGGSRPGGSCSDDSEYHQESLALPPTKLLEGGEIRSDVWNLILAHTRATPAFALDLRGLVGANNSAVRAMTQLADRFGVATVRSVMAGLIELSDGRMRQRLRSLPDATVWSTASLDNGGGLGGTYDVSLTLTKSGETLTFDYSASSLEPPGVVNCTVSGLMAGVNAALLPSLASDAPWNEGLLHPVEVVCPEVRIGDAAEPALSGGALEAASLVEMTAVEALSKLLTCSDELMGGAQAILASGPDRFVLSGVDANGVLRSRRLPHSSDGLTRDRPTMHGRQDVFARGNGDVIATIHESGGGWGDPLARRLAELRRDLTDGTVGEDAAIRFYGAVLTRDGQIDAEATTRRRAELLAERSQWPVARKPVEVPEGSVRICPLGDGLELVEAPCGLRLIRCACGQGLCRSDQPWREHAASQVGTDQRGVSMATKLSRELELRWYACPQCGVLLALDVARTASPAIHAVELN